MTEAIEQGNRRAEMDGTFVVFFRMTGNVRRTKQPVWFMQCGDLRRARRLMRRWVRAGKLGKPVLH